MAAINFFAPDAFSMVAWTEAINKIPNRYGRVRELGIFSDDPVSTTMAAVEIMNGVLNLVPTKPRGGTPALNISGKRTVRAFNVPHLPLDDVVLPGDVQNIRAFGQENVAETVAGVYARKLAEMRAKHAITLEWHRVKALQGLLLDANGTTLFNWFTEFGITPTVVSFALATTTTDILGKCFEVLDAIETNLKGEVTSGLPRALCSPGFFRSFVGHGKVQAAYAGYQAAESRLGGDTRRGFEFGGIMWEQYIGSASDADGNNRVFIPADEGIVFPMGTQSTFKTILAPADLLDSANTMGQELYAIAEPKRMQQGLDIHTEMNVLAINKRPEVVIRVTKA